MLEIQQKLTRYPFELSNEHASLFARYIIEDSSREDTFLHESNEVERTVAKSILSAFVRDYDLPEERKAREELARVLEGSGRNLASALGSLAPSGFISWLKLVEICRGIQLEFSEQCMNFLIGQLLARSPGGLQELNYRLLFEGL